MREQNKSLTPGAKKSREMSQTRPVDGTGTWLGAAGSARPPWGCCSIKEQLNNSTPQVHAHGSCRGYGTPGHTFPAERPFLRGQIEVPFNINVVYAQATAHKSQVTASCISATSLPWIMFFSGLPAAAHTCTGTFTQPKPRITREASAAAACTAGAEP